MPNFSNPAYGALPDFTDSDLPEDLADWASIQAPANLAMDELDGNGDGDGNGHLTSSGWPDGVWPPTSSPIQDFLPEENDGDVEGERDDSRDEDEWFQHQLYFARQALLNNSTPDTGGPSDAAAGPISPPASQVDSDGDDDDEDDEDEDSDHEWFNEQWFNGYYEDEDEENPDTPRITPLPRTPPPPPRIQRRSTRKSGGNVLDGGAPMLVFALQNWRERRDVIIAEKRKADRLEQEKLREEKLDQEVLVENRVLGLDHAGATGMGLLLRRNENGKRVVSGDGAAALRVVRDTLDYRKFATAGARRERNRRESEEEEEGEVVDAYVREDGSVDLFT
ncbi:uncharacterized protein Z520_11547 [Fonsecaea multimorphosa CBS 102226]|uniref:Uncharacterized protein n=1 Tax=Fonsecaea multimorphosa CBS 102226 TaxID=1442371 RepID=A0A0D2GT89_9EURO|nr:uncharacterized protein Z520_11547 [Fonsecaea multimorphosa CBS 102226]KIX92695.1 hypothetical protein Z520_11547 [Fonsecaea multimorphosa CBS 102226]OAL17937.1 hypothetical protein AYO22_11093 [Fonsecaea multimorphosa]